MAAGHSWNGITFDESVHVTGGSNLRDQVEITFPRVDGTLVIDKGWRAQVYTISGRYSNATMAGIWAWFAAAWAKEGSAGSLSLYGGDDLTNCKMNLRMVGGIRPKVGGGYVASYAAVFKKLAPNSS